MFVSIAVSALCSVLEATLLSTPLSYITGLEDQGVKGAKRLKKLKQNTERPIAAIKRIILFMIFVFLMFFVWFLLYMLPCPWWTLRQK